MIHGILNKFYQIYGWPFIIEKCIWNYKTEPKYGNIVYKDIWHY